jgi:hypothetical protein
MPLACFFFISLLSSPSPGRAVRTAAGEPLPPDYACGRFFDQFVTIASSSCNSIGTECIRPARARSFHTILIITPLEVASRAATSKFTTKHLHMELAMEPKKRDLVSQNTPVAQFLLAAIAAIVLLALTLMLLSQLSAAVLSRQEYCPDLPLLIQCSHPRLSL